MRIWIRLRREGSDVLLEIYEGWLREADLAKAGMGLNALQTLVRDPGFENIPPLFGMLFPLVRSAPAGLFNELAAILTRLADTARIVRYLWPARIVLKVARRTSALSTAASIRAVGMA